MLHSLRVWRGMRLLAVAAVCLVAIWRGGVEAAPTDLIISEYVEGSSNNKALEIYNGTGSAIDLAADQYVIQFYFNGSTTPNNAYISLTGTVNPGAVHVVVKANGGADPALAARGDQQYNGIWFNGNDAVVLRKGGTGGQLIDSIGQIGNDPGDTTGWGSDPTNTLDNTLRRKSGVCDGDTSPDNSFDPAAEWSGYPIDTFDGLGSHNGCPPDVAPEVANTTPNDGAAEVAVGANLQIEFSEPVAVASDWFEIDCSVSGLHNSGNTAVSGGPTNWTLNPNSDFANAEQCNVTIFALAVADTDDDDPPDTMLADHSFSFTTEPVVLPPDAAPEVVSTTPNDGAADVAVGANLQIVLSEPVAVASGWFEIDCGVSGLHTTGNTAVSGGPTNWTLNPNRDFAYGEQCSVTIFGSAVTDTDSDDPPDTMLADHSFSFTTELPVLPSDAPPAITATSPASGTEIVELGAEIMVTFSEAVTVSGSWFEIDCSNSGRRGPADAAVNGGPTTWRINPNADFVPGESCSVTIFAAGVADTDSDDPPDKMTADYSFDFTISSTEACGLQLGSYVLGTAAAPLQINIRALGTLACVSANLVQASHPRATVPLQTGRYWAITAVDASGNLATGYRVDVTLSSELPLDADSKACHYLSAADRWDCRYDGHSATAVTRLEVRDLEGDWTVGLKAGPTAVTFGAATVAASQAATIWPFVLLLLLTTAAHLAWRRN